VFTTHDPGDDSASLLADAINLYIPDPASGSGAFARPGFSLLNSADQLGISASRRGQGVYTHISADGTAYSFVVVGGKLYRVDSTLTTFTDVTPAGITITSASGSRVFFESFADELIVTDGTNRPWRGTNLASTPITGTYIDFDGAGTAWTAFGRPTVYGGCLFFILGTVDSVGARNDIAWSEPASPTIGYQQTNYDNRWTVAQTSASPIFAIVGTNTGLYYFREQSIGRIAGDVGPNLETTHTHDAVSFKTGTTLPGTVQLFGDTIYFCDAIGRPHRFELGGRPEPIWLQMRTIADASAVGFPLVSQQTATAALDPSLDIYLVAIWSSASASLASPTEMYAFDAKTGVYMGRWQIGAGMFIDCLGVLDENNGRGAVVVLGSKAVSGEAGYAWALNSLTAPGSILTEEDGDFLVTEDEGYTLSSEGTEELWLDNGEVPTIQAKTHRLGFSPDQATVVDRVVVVAGSDAPMSASITTPNTSAEALGTATPGASVNESFRGVWGAAQSGRDVAITVAPTTATEQWSVDVVEITGLAVPVGPEEW
jgi:hypothetical protein